MRVARFTGTDGIERCGSVQADHIAEFAGLSFQSWLEAGAAAPFQTGATWSTADVTLLPPISPAAKIFCVGYNYLSHGAEMNRDLPQSPTLFVRYPDSLVGAGVPIARPAESEQFDWEGEVGVVIGATGRRISTDDALSHVAGYTLVADNSIRDWQFQTTQATAGKNWDRSGSCGPWLTTADEVGDAPFTLETRLNGELKQHASTTELHFDVAALIAYISTFTTLRAGDLIATGTPAGIGYREAPPRFLRHGDRLEISSDLIGTLTNEVVDDLAPAEHLAQTAVAP